MLKGQMYKKVGRHSGCDGGTGPDGLEVKLKIDVVN